MPLLPTTLLSFHSLKLDFVSHSFAPHCLSVSNLQNALSNRTARHCTSKKNLHRFEIVVTTRRCCSSFLVLVHVESTIRLFFFFDSPFFFFSQRRMSKHEILSPSLLPIIMSDPVIVVSSPELSMPVSYVVSGAIGVGAILAYTVHNDLKHRASSRSSTTLFILMQWLMMLLAFRLTYRYQMSMGVWQSVILYASASLLGSALFFGCLTNDDRSSVTYKQIRVAVQ
jgi:hypothetical protein